MQLLHLRNTPIFHQLQIEEAFLRLGTDNLCVINEGSSPAIVMGISGKPEELIDLNKLEENPIPVIKRFSGGGTVVVDQDTLFVSFIFNQAAHPFAPYPEPILRWTEEVYKEVFPPSFALRENDYVLGDRKCGGNAQYLRKERWLHHTTFLWDYDPARMDLLLHPKKTPDYRTGRSHSEFITSLSAHMPSKGELIAQIKKTLAKRFPLEEIALAELEPLLAKPHRQSVCEIPLPWLSSEVSTH